MHTHYSTQEELFVGYSHIKLVIYMRKGVIYLFVTNGLQVLNYLSIFIYRTLKRLILRAFAYHVITGEIIKKQ